MAIEANRWPAAALAAKPDRSGPCHFSIFQADRVSITSTQFAGGDWRWELSDRDGAVLVAADGYRTEGQCRDAVAIL